MFPKSIQRYINVMFKKMNEIIMYFVAGKKKNSALNI